MIEPSVLLDMTAEIVEAFVSNNTIRANEIPDLIATVHAALGGIMSPKPAEEPVPELKPAVSIKKSVTDDFIICLEDGKHFKSLKRHLATAYNMTPDDYRSKWSLPRDYPMVAPGYAAKRSALAKATGLGARRTTAPAADAVSAPAPAFSSDPDAKAFDAPAKRRGRPKKAA